MALHFILCFSRVLLMDLLMSVSSKPFQTIYLNVSGTSGSLRPVEIIALTFYFGCELYG
jgi:hypothetical protein